MHVSWTGNRCLLCLEKATLSKEHLIPEALGGALTCSFLCTHCNSTLGSSVEASARADPSIRIAVQNLRAQIPELAKKLFEDQLVIIKGPGGQELGKMRRGEPRVKSRTEADGSLIQPTDHARKSVETILRRSGIHEIPLVEALRKLDATPDNHKLILTSGLEVVKWAVEKVDHDLSNSRLMSPLVPLKIGFEFLACHLGAAIYDESEQLHELRTALHEMVEVDPCFEVERLNASDYKPFHGIYFEGNDPYARVQIRLFGWLAFRVHFRRLSVSGPRFIYTQYLATGKEDVRILES